MQYSTGTVQYCTVLVLCFAVQYWYCALLYWCCAVLYSTKVDMNKGGKSSLHQDRKGVVVVARWWLGGCFLPPPTLIIGRYNLGGQGA